MSKNAEARAEQQARLIAMPSRESSSAKLKSDEPRGELSLLKLSRGEDASSALAKERRESSSALAQERPNFSISPLSTPCQLPLTPHEGCPR